MSPVETEPLLPPDTTDDSISERISGIVVKKKIGLGWLGGFAVAFSLLMMFNFAIACLFTYGVGIWGLEIPVAWGRSSPPSFISATSNGARPSIASPNR
jgi:hypothetical protein